LISTAIAAKKIALNRKTKYVYLHPIAIKNSLYSGVDYKLFSVKKNNCL